MKSYNNLFTKYLSDENIRLSLKTVVKGDKNKRTKAYLKNIRDHADEYIPEIRGYAAAFHNAKHTPIKMYDGVQRKVRWIVVPTVMEQIVHHMIMHVMQPIFFHGMYTYSVASIPGRGGLKGKKYLDKYLHSNDRSVKYILKLDIRKFFDSIPHDKLKERLAKIIRDKRFLGVLYELIDVQEVGLPLGFYTSQWLANWYLQPLDHYIKEELHVAHYVRYMDDQVLTGGSKKELRKVRIKIDKYMHERLGLTMKDDWQIFRFNCNGNKYRCVDFMGYKFYRNRTTLRKSILLKLKRCVTKICKEEKTRLFLIRRLLSYLGWLKHTDTYNVFQKYVAPYIDVRRCKRRVSNYDRRRNKQCLTA